MICSVNIEPDDAVAKPLMEVSTVFRPPISHRLGSGSISGLQINNGSNISANLLLSQRIAIIIKKVELRTKTEIEFNAQLPKPSLIIQKAGCINSCRMIPKVLIAINNLKNLFVIKYVKHLCSALKLPLKTMMSIKFHTVVVIVQIPFNNQKYNIFIQTNNNPN